jgi:putative ABC transport system substrate-binding protein
MITRRVFVGSLTGGLLAAPVAAEAQQAGRVWRIGYLSSQSAASAGRVSFDAFRQGLRDLGYVEEQNIVIESRWADGDYERLPTLAKELVSLNLDLIVSAGGDPTVRAVKAATTTVPIVFVTGSAVAAGIVSNLARPAANLTGFDLLAEELYTKQLALLKETLPKAVRVAVLWNPRIAGGEVRRKGLEIAAQALRVKLRFLEAQHPGEIETALAAIARERSDALFVSSDPMFASEAGRIIRWTARARLPTMYSWRIFAEGGGLMSYSTDLAAIYRRAATYVDKILRGAKPADLPVEQPTKYELVINLKTAKALGLTIPQSLLGRADEVIQ